MAKIGRNDPCWCGSGKKFKKCHIDRDRESPVHPAALRHELRRFFQAKDCLHPRASTAECTRVIAAHTIQRAGALANITDSTGHCLSFYPPEVASRSEPRRTGWREASTFYGFCAKHDGPTFAPLENHPFTGSSEQCFLLAYRAECHEFYQKRSSDRSHEPLRHRLDRGMTPSQQRVVQAIQAPLGAGVKKGLAESTRYKAQMDRELLEARFDRYDRTFVCFDGPVSVASSGAPTPNWSFSGESLVVLHDPAAEIPRLYTAVVPRDKGGAVVLIWRRDEAAPGRFVESLLAHQRDQLASILIQFMFAYIGNTYFSAAWWDTLRADHRLHIGRLAQMGNPYYEQWAYIDIPVPWNVTHVSGEWPTG